MLSSSASSLSILEVRFVIVLQTWDQGGYCEVDRGGGGGGGGRERKRERERE